VKIKVVHIHSANELVLTSDLTYPRFELVKSLERIALKEDEYGILLPSHQLNQKQMFFQGGEVRPGWSGILSIELLCWQPTTLRKGEVVAHLAVFKGEIEFKETE